MSQGVPSADQGGMVVIEPENSNHRSHGFGGYVFSHLRNWKSHAFTLSILFAIGGIGLTAMGVREYARTQLFSSTLPFAAFAGTYWIVSTIFGIVAWNKRWRVHPPSASGASLIAEKRSDTSTLEGACRILGISTNQSKDTALIEQQKTRILADLTQTHTKLTAGLSNTEENSPVVSALQLMIKDVDAAYNKLIAMATNKVL
jgi:hypothetical protein